jgi:ankyrin repeat protein
MSEKLEKQLIGEFIDAVIQDQSRAQLLLKDYPILLDSRWIHNETVLHFLAVENYLDGVRFLAKLGADVDSTNEFGDTALIDVACLGNDKVAEVLLEHGANPNAYSETNDNPLHCAVASGNARLVGLLLDYGAKYSYETDIGETVVDVLPQKKASRKAVLEEFAKRNIELAS